MSYREIIEFAQKAFKPKSVIKIKIAQTKTTRYTDDGVYDKVISPENVKRAIMQTAASRSH